MISNNIDFMLIKLTKCNLMFQHTIKFSNNLNDKQRINLDSLLSLAGLFKDDNS
jgi:hypothetical protein